MIESPIIRVVVKERKTKLQAAHCSRRCTFKQDKIHDFAWFADKEFFVFESKQTLSDSSATINTYLYSTNEYDKSAIQYVNQGVKFYSDKVGNYPYASASAVIGPLKAGGGHGIPHDYRSC